MIKTRQDEQVVGYGNSCSHLTMPLDTKEVENSIFTFAYHEFKYRFSHGKYLTALGMPL